MTNEIQWEADPSGEIIRIDESTLIGKMYADYVRKVTAGKDAELKKLTEKLLSREMYQRELKSEMNNMCDALRAQQAELKAVKANLQNAVLTSLKVPREPVLPNQSSKPIMYANEQELKDRISLPCTDWSKTRYCTVPLYLAEPVKEEYVSVAIVKSAPQPTGRGRKVYTESINDALPNLPDGTILYVAPNEIK